ncbi:hypothetical protein OG308_24280 [Nocardia salmonicida]|uniref:Lipoyl-binding domain-containing protein n=1 Tax=Nocardia salmonicida TaxID=53431 RepID=A0ABZ1N379_9NOCA
MELSIPQLGVTMVEGTLTEWLVEDGATVTAGEGIYMLGTDKVETEIAAPANGVLTIKGEEGETYAVGTVIGELST